MSDDTTAAGEPVRRLGDRYELGETLGRGGMAEVHEGRDLRLGRRVAVKILRPDLARNRRSRRASAARPSPPPPSTTPTSSPSTTPARTCSASARTRSWSRTS